MNVITETSQLVSGKWYACAIGDEKNEFNWGGATLAQYDGESMRDEDGTEATMYDTILSECVLAINADAFVLQA